MRVIEAPTRDTLGDTPAELLRRLEQPTAFVVPGKNRQRCRLIVTLLHGDEPSGVSAFLAWLRADPEPAVDVVCAIANVEAGAAEPAFSHRMLPGRADLNRSFSPILDTADGDIVRGLLAVIDRVTPECLVDLHNTSGDNPPYAIATRIDDDRLRLAGLFAQRIVHTDLVLGTMLDVTAKIPGVSIECGRSGDPAADAVALEGLTTFAQVQKLPVRDVTVYEHPIRITLLHDRLEVRPDLDQHNFGQLRKGEHIARVRDGAPWPVRAFGADGRDRSRDLFAMDEDLLVVTQTVIPSMITTDVQSAIQDCLCYLVSESS